MVSDRARFPREFREPFNLDSESTFSRSPAEAVACEWVADWLAAAVCSESMVLWCEQLVPYRVPYEFRDRVQIELAHDINAMRLGCLGRNSKRRCHFFVALSFCKQMNNL